MKWPIQIPVWDTVTPQYVDKFAIIITLEDEEGGVYKSIKSIFELASNIPLACTNVGGCSSEETLYENLFSSWEAGSPSF